MGFYFYILFSSTGRLGFLSAPIEQKQTLLGPKNQAQRAQNIYNHLWWLINFEDRPLVEVFW